MSVQDLYMHAKSTMDPALMLPYSIQHGRIGGVSIRLQFNQPASWSLATCRLLECLQHLLSWTLEREARQELSRDL